MEREPKYIFTGNIIRSHRIKHKWTQSDLAKRIGIKKNTISAYERGVVEIPHSRLQAIAKAFDIKTTDLLPIEGTGEIDSISKHINEAKARLDGEQLEFLEKVIEKTLSLDGSERENFLKNIKIAVQIFDK